MANVSNITLTAVSASGTTTDTWTPYNTYSKLEEDYHLTWVKQYRQLHPGDILIDVTVYEPLLGDISLARLLDGNHPLTLTLSLSLSPLAAQSAW